jgi:hypothetical protein
MALSHTHFPMLLDQASGNLRHPLLGATSGDGKRIFHPWIYIAQIGYDILRATLSAQVKRSPTTPPPTARS